MAVNDRTRRVLWARSGNACAICGIELVSENGDGVGVSIIGEECHIVARSAGGPRGKEAPPGGDVDGHGNLLLLCRNDHRRIDETPEAYPLSTLVDLKARHEENVRKSRTPSPVQREEALEQLARDARARCVERFQVLGVSRALAEEFADDPDVGDAAAQLVFRHRSPVTVLLGDVGAGKSLGGERIHLNAIAEAREDPEAPAPVWIRAQEVTGNLRDVVQHAADQHQAEPSRHGVALVVDGLDEPGPGAALRLLSEARLLALAWPNTTVLLTTRWLADVGNRDERVQLPALPEEAAWALVTRIAPAGPTRSARWPASVREAIRRPLFAVALGVALEEDDRFRPSAPAAIVARVVRRALRDLSADRFQTMEAIAVASLLAGGRPVWAADHAPLSERQDLLRSRLLIEEDGWLRFPLILIAQWFASRRLADGQLDIDALLEHPDQLELWRYPLAIAVTDAPSRTVDRIIGQLARRHPALASLVLDEATRQFGGDYTLTGNWRTAATAIRSAEAAWIDGLGPLAAHVSPLDDHSELPSLGAHLEQGRLTALWYRGSDRRGEVFELTDSDLELLTVDVHDFGPGHSSGAYGAPGWAWRWTRHELRRGVSQMLRERTLPVAGSALEEEAVFFSAIRLLGTGSGDPGPLDISRFIEPEATIIVGDIYENVEVSVPRSLQDALRRYADPDGMLHSPLPGPDRRTSGGWVWSDYSAEAVRTRAEAVYRIATQAYEELVGTLFSTLAPRMALAATLPAHVRVEVGMSESSVDDRGPSFTYWFEPQRTGRSTASAELNPSGASGWDRVAEIDDQLAALRPHAASWLSSMVHTSFDVDLLGSFPAAQQVYEWLWADLERVGWVEGNLGYWPSQRLARLGDDWVSGHVLAKCERLV